MKWMIALPAFLIGVVLGILYEHIRMAELWELSDTIRDVRVKMLEQQVKERE